MVVFIGDLDLESYRRFFPDIRSSEVVMTHERIHHIVSGHPEIAENDFLYLRQLIESPDYVFADSSPNTVRLMKAFSDAGKWYRIIVRLSIVGDDEGHKNSVLTFYSISQKRYDRYVRNEKLLFSNI